MKTDIKRELNYAIIALETKQKIELIEIEKKINFFQENYTPKKIIKHALKDFLANSNISSNVFNASLSLLSAYVSGKLINNSTNNFLKKIIGYGLEFLIIRLLAKTK